MRVNTVMEVIKAKFIKTTLIYEPAFQLSSRNTEKNKVKDLLFCLTGV